MLVRAKKPLLGLRQKPQPKRLLTGNTMTLSAAHATVLNDILSQYAAQINPPETSSPTAKTRQLRAVRPKATAKTVPALPAVKVAHIALISARDFVIAMRKADRNEKIKLIDQYVGYDNALDFGTQEMVALRKANNSINPPRNAGVYSVQATVSGYVAGMPKRDEKAIQDLEARERLAVATMLDLQKQALECGDSVQAALLSAKADLETERVVSIRRELNTLTR